MNTFKNAIQNQTSRTENGMKCQKNPGNECVSLFFKIGASRGKDIIPQFVAAFVEDRDLALRITQWARDIRGGAGERQLFKDILAYLEKSEPAIALQLLNKISEIGRWDDMFIDYTNSKVKLYAYNLIHSALLRGNSLCAKWCPRKGKTAVALRNHMSMSPKQYRKTLVSLTNVVETQMCAGKWDEINFSHVPAVASSRYKSAFYRQAEEKFTAYVDALTNGDPKVKVNAGAVYPYDILKGIQFSYYNSSCNMSETELNHVIAQWNVLENFIGDANVLPMVDVSASMECSAGGSSITCMDVAVSLGLYCADKNTGNFANTFLTFSEESELVNLKGDIVQKLVQMKRSNWGMNTDLNRAFEKVLDVAVKGNVDQNEMPKIVLIMSDMQFDRCTNFDDSAIQMIRRKYESAGYKMPQVVFWNLNANDNVPVKYNESGVALISGFSPAIMKAVLAVDFEDFSPESVMRQAICIERYDI